MIGARVSLIGGALLFEAGAEIDADGAPNAYAPHGSGLAPLDNIDNAGHPGDYWAVVVNSAGVPVVQQQGDPFPGYCVSTNTLIDARYGQRDPRRYADARVVPFIVVPPQLVARGVRMGDLAVVIYQGRRCGALVGDQGPGNHYGEVSICTADDMGIPGPGKVHGRGVADGVTYVIFPGSHATPAWPRAADEIRAAALAKHAAWAAENGVALGSESSEGGDGAA